MADLSTEYMGLSLRNPLIVASCGLVGTPEGVRQCAEAGAGAVVLKSLFEEQIDAEVDEIEEHTWLLGHPEAFDYVRGMGMELGPREYLVLVSQAKKQTSIPIIASLNCISPRWWLDYAKQIELAGADALELNVAVIPSDPDRTSAETERRYFDVLAGVRNELKIPVAMKIHPYFTSVPRLAGELCNRGADALVFFNRFYKLDIDIENLGLASGDRFSSPQEIYPSLRWIILLAGGLPCDIAASTGVHDGAGVIKQLLAGATAVQVCTTLYRNGVEYIAQILGDVKEWMTRHGFDSVDQFRGKLSQSGSDRPELYERLQYIKALVGIE